MIDDVVRIMSARLPRLEIVVADDGSTDGTAEVLRALQRQHACLRIVHHVRNLGYGAAARSALSVATEEVVLLTDADRQFELECIDEFLTAIVGCDMVVGFRAPRRDPPTRVLAGRAWTTLVNRLCGYAARDVNCGFKAVWRDALASIVPGITARGATFSAEWLLRSRSAGLTVRELPVRHRPRTLGTPTGLRPTVVGRAVIELLQLRRNLGALGRVPAWSERPRGT